MYQRIARILALAGSLLACESPEPDSSSRDVYQALDSAFAVDASEAPAVPDSLARLLERINERLGAVSAWRLRAEMLLRADSATPRADTIFLQLRSTLEPIIRAGTASFYETDFQVVIWPEGAAADYRRRTQQDSATQLTLRDGVVADSVIAVLASQGVWSARAEGSTHFERSEAMLLSWLGRFLTRQLQAFLQFAANQQAAPFADDAALMVTPDELARRILDAEQLRAEFPDSPAQQELLVWYRQYLATYLGGLPNTPAFDWNSGVLRPHFRKSHEEFLDAHGSTAAGRIVAEYTRLLERSGFARTPEVDRYLQTQWASVMEH